MVRTEDDEVVMVRSWRNHERLALWYDREFGRELYLDFDKIKREPGLVSDYCLEYGEPAPRVRYYYSINGRRVPMKPSYWMYRSPEPDRGAAGRSFPEPNILFLPLKSENPTTRPMRAPSREEKDIPASHLTEAVLPQGLARVEQTAPLPAALTEENAAGLANYNANNNEKVRTAERGTRCRHGYDVVGFFNGNSTREAIWGPTSRAQY
jgi:hypothetical protein